MTKHKEIEINSRVVQAKEKSQSFKMWRCKYSNIEGIDKINNSELLKIYISLNARANKHRVRTTFRTQELKIASHSWIPAIPVDD